MCILCFEHNGFVRTLPYFANVHFALWNISQQIELLNWSYYNYYKITMDDNKRVHQASNIS